MSFCMRCGKQTDNADFICDDCRREQERPEEEATQNFSAANTEGRAEDSAGKLHGAETDGFGMDGGQPSSPQDDDKNVPPQRQSGANENVPPQWQPGPNGNVPPRWQPGTNGNVPPQWRPGPNGNVPPQWRPGPNGNVPLQWRPGPNENVPPQWQPGPNGNVPPQGVLYGTPWSAPYTPPPPVDRSKFPLNKCGLIGMIFSLAAFICFIAIFFVAFAFIAQHPEWADPFYEMTYAEVFSMMIGVLVPLLFAGIFSVTGVILSAVGLARYRRFRSVGFAIAGLVIGVIVLLILISIFGSIQY